MQFKTNIYTTGVRNINGKRFYSSENIPLNILFFGSDEFSIHSLTAMHRLKQITSLVGKIQVVTRRPKWCGRQMSVLRYPPIVEAAEKLRLSSPILCDSRKDMLGLREIAKNENYNMIIAVSFGKLIPAELLSSIKYSLNLHPSLLPRYKGASPIQYALLNQDDYTGVTVQTLHPSKFDHGSIVAETDPLKIDDLLAKGPISNFDLDTPIKTATLMDQLGLRGASLLKQVIMQQLYLKDQHVVRKNTGYEASYAPKIIPEMKHINWEKDTAEGLLNKLQVLGPIFAHKEVGNKDKKTSLKRVIFHEFNVSTLDKSNELQSPGHFMFDEDEKCIYVRCKDNKYLRVNQLQFEGFKIESAKQFDISLKKRCGVDLSCRKVLL